MSEVWPLDVKNKLTGAARDAIRPFKCLLLMPFEGRFDEVAKHIKNTVSKVAKQLITDDVLGMQQPVDIKRLDWVTSSGVIQQEIWQEIVEADIIFCDITGYNPNVMFESGVCAAWKEMKHVVFIKDSFFKQQSAFDIAPIRYAEYELTSDGIVSFQRKVAKLTQNVLIGFPDRHVSAPEIRLPLEIEFKDNRDDLRLYTPPLAHRRVIDGALEFGSSRFYAHSWASIGKEMFLNFSLEFSARFSNPISSSAYIGVGLRSQHYFTNFAHLFYLHRNGNIVLHEPVDNLSDRGDDTLRKPMEIDLMGYHHFRIVFNEAALIVQVDDFSHTSRVAQMKKVSGPGLIRFQVCGSWMAINQVKVTNTNVT